MGLELLAKRFAGARSRHGCVSVGWTGKRSAQLAIEAAAQEAQLRDAALNVVTVLPVLPSHVAGSVESSNQESPLSDAIGDLEQRYPGLGITISHKTGDVAAALSAAAASSELLVLGCYHSANPCRLRTGRLAEVLMRLGHCPVMLVGRATQPAGAVAAPGQQ